MLNRIAPAALAAAFLIAPILPAHADTGKNIVEVATEAGSFDTLLAAATAAGLVDTLTGEGPFTVFAPTDDAFAKLPEGAIEALLADTDKLTAILLHHVVAGKVMAADVVELESATTVFGQDLAIDTEDGVKVDDARVVATDIEASNGVIHVIDSVLLPKDIVDLAISNENFSTLVAAVAAAEFVELLKGDGPFTVFAPTNAAFAQLPEEVLAELLKPENIEQLQAILAYHVVPGKVMAADVVKLESATTAQGSDLTITVSEEDGVTIDDAKILVTDIPALNGVIHVIDTVILPQG
jgi:transforming growth factor-beta-induced protein